MGTVAILSAKRTPIGDFCGGFSQVAATELGSAAIKAAVAEADLGPDRIDEVVMGCVLPAGLGQAPARQAAIGAGIPESVPATTVNKMCGSGMKSVMLAHDAIALGNATGAVAGGMENMTRAPYILPAMREGARIGHSGAIDHMFLDGLEDAYDRGRLMGEFAEDCAASYQFTRAAQDGFATASLRKAAAAATSGASQAELQPVPEGRRKGARMVESDERPARAKPERIPALKPAFRTDGTVTAANSSSISDGAAALVLCEESLAKSLGLAVRARVVGHASYAHAPNLFTTAPVYAARELMRKVSWKAGDVDLWEVNEAFAVVAMAFGRELGIPEDRLNVRGGACALGHPIGASGARIMVTLLHAMEHAQAKRGIAAICIGGGEATAIAVEIP